MEISVQTSFTPAEMWSQREPHYLHVWSDQTASWLKRCINVFSLIQIRRTDTDRACQYQVDMLSKWLLKKNYQPKFKMNPAHVGDFKLSSLSRPSSSRNTTCTQQPLTYRTIWNMHDRAQNSPLSRTQTPQLRISSSSLSFTHIVHHLILYNTKWRQTSETIPPLTRQLIRFFWGSSSSLKGNTDLQPGIKQQQRCALHSCSDWTMAAGICFQLEGFFFLHWAQIRGNTDNHLLLQSTAAAPPDTKDLFPKTPPAPLLGTKCGLVVTVEKAQMIKSSKMSLLCIRDWRRSLTLMSCCWSLSLEWNSTCGCLQDAGKTKCLWNINSISKISQKLLNKHRLL